MILKFDKYHGAGNDFIIINNFDHHLSQLLSAKIIQNICDRHFGIGADGLILFEKDEKNDFSMRYFNADGNEGSMCGNGGRCIVAYAKKNNLIANETRFKAIDGLHYARILSDGIISLKMSDIQGIKSHNDDIVIDSGSPHYIRYVHTIEDINVFELGRKICNQNEFQPDGINVNFVQDDKDLPEIRTYERGVENETMACGTGCVAAAVSLKKDASDGNYKVMIKTLGGILEISFEKKDTLYQNIYLTGPAKHVFSGQYETT